MPRVARSPIAALVLVALALVGGACEVTSSVDVHVAEDGSGTVEVAVDLDGEAVERVGDVESQLRLDDLTSGGWEIESHETADGGWRVSGSKAFGSPGGLQGVLDEIAGAGDGFRDWKIAIEEGFGSTRWNVDGRVVLTGSIAGFSDPGLAEALDGLALARTPEELAAEIGDATFPLTVAVHLPAPIDDTNGTVSEADDAASSWDFEVIGESTDQSLSATALDEDQGPLRLVVMGALLILVALALLVVARNRGRSATSGWRVQSSQSGQSSQSVQCGR